MQNAIDDNIYNVYSDYTHRNKHNTATTETTYSNSDALQDSILKLLEKQADKDSQINVNDEIEAKKLLAVITKNCKINRFARDGVATAYTDELKKSGATYSEDQNNWMHNHITSLLSDPVEIEFFELYYVEGLKYVEIAEKLELNERTIRRMSQRVSTKIMKMNIAELIDTSFVGDIAGMEHHTVKTNHNYFIKQTVNDWDLWNGQSDFSDYKPMKSTKYNIVSDKPLSYHGLYVFEKKDSYSNMLGVDIS